MALGKQAKPLRTNGFAVDMPGAFHAVVRDFPDPSLVKAERKRLSGFWFLHWTDGKLYHVRLAAGGPNLDGTPVTVSTSDHPWLLRSRLDDAIAEAFPKYEPQRLRPFTFLAQKSELLAEAAEEARIAHPLLNAFSVTPRYVLNAKIYEPREGEPRVGVFVTVNMKYAIDSGLAELHAAGVDLKGLHVVRRHPDEGERRHAGRVASLASGRVQLSEAADQDDFSVDDLQLEGSRENFSICMLALLGHRTRQLQEALEAAESNYRLGPDFDRVVEQVGDHLAKRHIELGDGISVSIGKRIIIENSATDTAVYVAPPVQYVFDRTGASSSELAWPGLSRYGPYDRTSFPTKSPRLLVVFPVSTRGKVETFLASLRDGLGSARRFYPAGFVKLFGLVKLDYVLCPVDLAGVPHNRAEAAYRAAIEKSLQSEERVDGAIVVLLNEQADLPDLINPYVRTKAMLLTLGIPSQQIKMSNASKPPESLQYSLQNIAVSLYAKMNGTPWTVHQDKGIGDELVIGMGFAELSGSRSEGRKRYVGITTVFSGDGTYVLGNVSNECDYENYPALVREAMLSVLREVKKRNNWRPGDTIRVVFHAHRPLKRIDVAKIVFECTREVGSDQDIQLAFVTVTLDHPFYLMDPKEPGVPVKFQSEDMKGEWAPARGTIARLGRSTRLLSVNSGTLIKRPLTPLPRPLLISLHPDSTFKDVDYLAEQVLKFTSLSWRSTLPAGTPVTIFYSEKIAELLGRMRAVPDWSGTALTVKLRYSRWFL